MIPGLHPLVVKAFLGELGLNRVDARRLVSGLGSLFITPCSRRSGLLLRKFWRLRFRDQKLGDPTHLAELPASCAHLLHLRSGPEFDQCAFGNFR